MICPECGRTDLTPMVNGKVPRHQIYDFLADYPSRSMTGGWCKGSYTQVEPERTKMTRADFRSVLAFVSAWLSIEALRDQDLVDRMIARYFDPTNGEAST